MSALQALLRDRREEYDAHHALASSLENQIFSGEDLSFGSIRLSARHLLTIKSGLIVHLYNVVEALMSRSMSMVGHAFGTVSPKSWSGAARREWLREHGVARIEGSPETRLKSFEAFSSKLLADVPLGPQHIRKPPGTWSDENIGTFLTRLGIVLPMQPDLHRRTAKKVYFGEKTPLTFLANRRNDVAHGHRTFEDGAKDLTLARIQEIASVMFDYMDLVVSAIQDYVDQRLFVATP